MIKFLISRPIAVSMTFLALVIVGLVSMNIIPVSLMPDIDIPQVTVKVNCPNSGAREVEDVYVSRIRNSLQQTSHLEDISSTSSNGKATIVLRFKYGTNINYANLEVNEKVDGLMHYMPDDFERPKVIKSKASDIPAFYVNISLKKGAEQERFLELSSFTQAVIKRRIEQLPEVALVDVSGLVHPEIYIRPNQTVTKQLGITDKEIEAALKAGNVNIGNIKVKEGAYEYNIRYSSAIVERTDLEDLLITAGDRVFRLGEVADIGVRNQNTQGKFINKGKQAITLAVIKKADVQMNELQSSFSDLLMELQKDYKRIDIEISRDQSALLNVSISNLRNTLIIGGVLAFLIVFLFLKDKKAPWLIGLTIPVSIIISILVFFLAGLSINIISLSGLVLGVGMMIDNSIIVIDNIDQHYKDKALDEACIAGTNEIIRPLLSSVLTTCAVFLPLIFLSGIAGELFYDQAIAVTIGLMISFIVSITLLPVYFRVFHGNSHHAPLTPKGGSQPTALSNHRDGDLTIAESTSSAPSVDTPLGAGGERGKRKIFSFSIFSHIEKFYGGLYDYLMKRKGFSLTVVAVFTAVGLYLLVISPKEAFPAFEETDVFARISWNENITLEESEERIANLHELIFEEKQDYSAFIGVQQFILNHLGEMEEDECIIYYEADDVEALETYKKALQQHVAQQYYKAQVHFEQAPNVFSQIFENKGAMLELNYVSDNKRQLLEPQRAQDNAKSLLKDVGLETEPLALQEYLILKPRTDRLVQYGISSSYLYNRLRQALDGYEVGTLKSGANYTSIVLSDKQQSIEKVISQLYLNGANGAKYPVRELVTLDKGVDYKSIPGGKEGAYIKITPITGAEDLGDLVAEIKAKHHPVASSYFLSGNYFTNQRLFFEMLIVLCISTLLLYFILAAQFESLLQPVIVLSEIPIDVAGAMFVLKLGGGTVNIMSMIGIVVMSGIIINDSILKIDTINRIRKTGVNINDAIHQAGMRRLKPIVMTSITTILALVPFLFGSSMGNVLQRPLALTIIGGMTVGTIISLFFIPMMYQILESPSRKKQGKESGKSPINTL